MRRFPKWFRLVFDDPDSTKRVKVKNVSPSPSYNGSAIGDWETYMKRQATNCARCGQPLSNDDKVGGHVRKVEGLSFDMYIVPLCKECNNPSVTTSFEVSKSDMVRVFDLERSRKK